LPRKSSQALGDTRDLVTHWDCYHHLHRHE
jgi:hypothetical protein